MFQIKLTTGEKNRLIASRRAATVYFFQFERPALLVCSFIDRRQIVTESGAKQSVITLVRLSFFFFSIPKRVECVILGNADICKIWLQQWEYKQKSWAGSYKCNLHKERGGSGPAEPEDQRRVSVSGWMGFALRPRSSSLCHPVHRFLSM